MPRSLGKNRLIVDPLGSGICIEVSLHCSKSMGRGPSVPNEGYPWLWTPRETSSREGAEDSTRGALPPPSKDA